MQPKSLITTSGVVVGVALVTPMFGWARNVTRHTPDLKTAQPVSLFLGTAIFWVVKKLNFNNKNIVTFLLPNLQYVRVAADYFKCQSSAVHHLHCVSLPPVFFLRC